MKHQGLDHLAIVVPDTEAALATWRDTLGFPLLFSEVVNGGTVRLNHLDLGNTHRGGWGSVAAGSGDAFCPRGGVWLPQLEPAHMGRGEGARPGEGGGRGFGVRRAVVAGQLLPGVPAWQLGAEARFSSPPYIVFPRNIGDAKALTEAVCRLRT
jgi:catechol 2,3-dioxygenase-like lactoylglutathione lyase family enzyme